MHASKLTPGQKMHVSEKNLVRKICKYAACAECWYVQFWGT